MISSRVLVDVPPNSVILCHKFSEIDASTAAWKPVMIGTQTAADELHKLTL